MWIWLSMHRRNLHWALSSLCKSFRISKAQCAMLAWDVIVSELVHSLLHPDLHRYVHMNHFFENQNCFLVFGGISLVFGGTLMYMSLFLFWQRHIRATWHCQAPLCRWTLRIHWWDEGTLWRTLGDTSTGGLHPLAVNDWLETFLV